MLEILLKETWLEFSKSGIQHNEYWYEAVHSLHQGNFSEAASDLTKSLSI